MHKEGGLCGKEGRKVEHECFGGGGCGGGGGGGVWGVEGSDFYIEYC